LQTGKCDAPEPFLADLDAGGPNPDSLPVQPVPPPSTTPTSVQPNPGESPTLKSSVGSPTAASSASFSTPVATPLPDVDDGFLTPTPTEPKVNTRYQLSAELNYDLHLLTVNERIFFTNSFSSDPRSVAPGRANPVPICIPLKSLAWEMKRRSIPIGKISVKFTCPYASQFNRESR
jgi:hypothetical protein